jgi:catalase
MTNRPRLTTTAGNPVADNQKTVTAGPHGPVLLQDYQHIEKLAHQNPERIPERTVHAKGWGAYGTFPVTNDITRYTKARVFSKVGKKSELITRFSNVAGELGAADHERDVATSAHQPALADRDVGFLVAVAEKPHNVTILMSDRGLPQGPRFMNDCGSHICSFIHARNERYWVKSYVTAVDQNRRASRKSA